MSAPQGKSCGTCRFGTLLQSATLNLVICQRYPPTVIGPPSGGTSIPREHFPVLSASFGWCGEFASKTHPEERGI